MGDGTNELRNVLSDALTAWKEKTVNLHHKSHFLGRARQRTMSTVEGTAAGQDVIVDGYRSLAGLGERVVVQE